MIARLARRLSIALLVRVARIEHDLSCEQRPQLAREFGDRLERNVAGSGTGERSTEGRNPESAGVALGLPLDPRARFFVDESPFTIVGAQPLP